MSEEDNNTVGNRAYQNLPEKDRWLLGLLDNNDTLSKEDVISTLAGAAPDAMQILQDGLDPDAESYGASIEEIAQDLDSRLSREELTQLVNLNLDTDEIESVIMESNWPMLAAESQAAALYDAIEEIKQNSSSYEVNESEIADAGNLSPSNGGQGQSTDKGIV